MEEKKIIEGYQKAQLYMSDNLKFSESAGNFEVIQYYRRCGLNVIPLLADGSKKPLWKWADYQTLPVLDHQLAIFKFQNVGIGCVCGVTSGNLEILDFDRDGFFIPWCKEVHRRMGVDLLRRFPIIKTPSDGRHVYYRCDLIEGNQKLAYDLDDIDGEVIAIETRGQGGYSILPGSPPETHVLKLPYSFISGSFADVPRISQDQRQNLLEAARGLSRASPKIKPVYFSNSSQTSHDERPGADFARRGNWSDILEPKGWTLIEIHGRVANWRRSGKSEWSSSATTGYCMSPDGLDLLKVFSSNAFPFETDCTYNKFSAYTMLYHDGDFTSAAKALAKQGYGSNLTNYEQLYNHILMRYFK